MSEVYVLVEVKKSVVAKILAYVMLCLTIVSALFSLMGFVIFFPVMFVFGVIWYFLQFRSDKEYEYSYFDGDVRFARITNKSRRKTLKGHNIEDVLQIAPAGDRSVYKYENDNTVDVKDYTSRVEGVPYYDMVVKSAEKIILYKVELDDKYLDAVCIKHGAKVIRR